MTKKEKQDIKILSEAMARNPLPTDRLKVFLDVNIERKRQTDKFGLQNHDVFLWLAILGEEKGECDNAAIEMKFTGSKTIQDLRAELVQVAAVAVQIIEWVDRTTADGEKQKLINSLTK